MQTTFKNTVLICLCISMLSCVSNKKFTSMQEQYQKDLETANKQLGECGTSLNEQINHLAACNKELDKLKDQLNASKKTIKKQEGEIGRLENQIDKQLDQMGNLTVLSQSASDNIKETLSQLEKKDEYIHLLQAAKSKADSINLALAVNLKSVLRQGIDDRDVDIKVDKTVVFINLSDKMLYQSGSANLTTRAHEVLGKIAKIVESRPDVEVMVEGYTDNVPISNSCMKDNWDLSVKRATSVIRVLQERYNVDPNRLIAAGRGEYNVLASNDTAEGRATNRRTRIIILPKLNQFYDLLNPANTPK